MLIDSSLIIVGFALLGISANFLVKGASSLARHFGISDLVTGLTIVALSTSAPELVVSLLAALRNNGGIAVGNVVGSNIANLCLIVGVCGLITPLAITRGAVWREIPFCLATSAVLLITVYFNNRPFILSRPEGVALLGCFGVFVAFMLLSSTSPPAPDVRLGASNMFLALFAVVAGAAGLVVGGEIIVGNAVSVAKILGVSDQLIGVTIVALGTSLPELAASLAAVFRKQPDIAIGNIVGSNIMNTCLVLGIASVTRPILASESFTPDALIIMGASLALFVFMFTGRKHRIDRWEAALFLAAYFAYIFYAIHRR